MTQLVGGELVAGPEGAEEEVGGETEDHGGVRRGQPMERVEERRAAGPSPAGSGLRPSAPGPKGRGAPGSEDAGQAGRQEPAGLHMKGGGSRMGRRVVYLPLQRCRL